MKKIHPDLATDNDDDEIDGSLVYRTSGDEEPKEEEEEKIDPRWEALKKFRNN